MPNWLVGCLTQQFAFVRSFVQRAHRAGARMMMKMMMKMMIKFALKKPHFLSLFAFSLFPSFSSLASASPVLTPPPLRCSQISLTANSNKAEIPAQASRATCELHREKTQKSSPIKKPAPEAKLCRQSGAHNLAQFATASFLHWMRGGAGTEQMIVARGAHCRCYWQTASSLLCRRRHCCCSQ